MSNYGELSDFEINKRVADSMSLAWHFIGSDGGWIYADRYCELGEGGKAVDLPDYCNNPADAWPVIVDLMQKGSWCFSKEGAIFIPKPLDYSNMNKNTNPLRAAMICYLMMKEVE